MTDYLHILEPYNGMKTRYSCPECQKNEKTFSRYIDTETGEQIHPNVGRCNRESKCGYHYTPKQYFLDNNTFCDSTTPKANICQPQPKPASYIPVDIFKASLKPSAFETNHFVRFLIDLFSVEITSEVISKYFIATSKYWKGATVFWQIDTKGKIRTGKIMLYNPSTGKRVKKPHNHVNWVHKAIKQPDFSLKQCFYGEHLLIDKSKPVAIVESEKTAIICSVYLPQFIWLAVGGLSYLNSEKCNVLKGRSVTLFPDLNGFDKWSKKAKKLSHITNFQISDLLERKANETERKQGLDLADYLMRFNHKEFTNTEDENIGPTANIQQFDEVVKIERIIQAKNWSNDITELETYFLSIELPTQPIKLNDCTTITDCALFIESHFATVKANNGNRTFLPYLNRLQELKQIQSSLTI